MEKPRNKSSIGRPVLKSAAPAAPSPAPEPTPAAESIAPVFEEETASLDMPQAESPARRSSESPRLRVGITPGDGASLHYGALARLFSDSSVFESMLPFVYGRADLLVAAAEKIGWNDMNVSCPQQLQDVKGKRIQVLTPPAAPEEEGADDAFATLQMGIRHLAQGHLRVLVSLPLTDEDVRQKHADFKNQTIAVAEIFSGSPFRMLLTHNLRLSFLTNAGKQDAASYLNAQRVEQRIRAMFEALRNDFSITTPRIAVLSADVQGKKALDNPIDTGVLKPLITRLMEEEMPVFGPYAAQDFFNKPDRNAFDAVLCMYKEQAETVFNIFHKEECCYYTAGLPVVHVEPIFPNNDTETAFHAVFNAVCTAVDIDAARQQNMLLSEDSLGYGTPSYHNDSHEEN